MLGWCAVEKEIIRFKKFDLPISIRRLHLKDGGSYRGLHSHKAIEIVEVKRGILNCHIQEEIIPVHPKEIIFINSNIGHRLSSEDAEISYMHFDASLLQDLPLDGQYPMLQAFISHTKAEPYSVYEDNGEIAELLNKINHKYDAAGNESSWYLKAYLYELVAFMYSRRFIFQQTIPGERIKKIKPIVHYIDSNFKSHITLEDICGAVQYNKYTICHTFKSVTGSTIFEYINFLRVHCAAEMLRKPQNAISDIAASCGFSSDTYFNRVFKSFFGCSPSVYRKQLSN